jgi:hypothetical protein
MWGRRDVPRSIAPGVDPCHKELSRVLLSHRIAGFVRNAHSRAPQHVAGVRPMACTAGEDLISPTAAVAEAKAA